MRAILVLVLTAVLLYLYHKIFTVVYVNALAGIIREIAVCFVLALVICSIIFNALGITADSKDAKTNQPSSNQPPVQEQTSPVRDLFPWQESSQEPPIKSFYGSFNSTSLLNNGIFDVSLIIGDSKWTPDGINIFGVATAPGFNFVQNLDIDIPMPEGNTFTFQADEIASTLTITLHPEEHTLEITQEPMNSEVEAAYTGSYVDTETWESMRGEWSAVIERNQELAMPNRWIGDYNGSYILEAFIEGEEGTPYTRFDIKSHEQNANTFQFLPALWVGSNGNYGNPLDWAFYDIPFPLGNDKSRHIEYETNDGLIAFDVLDDKADGRHVIRVTDCPHLECTGVFVSGAENLSDNFIQQGKRLNWPGTYVCEKGGVDGTKSISVSQADDQLLSIEMIHNYADGRVETYHATAEINAYGNGAYYAVSGSGEKWLDFQLQEDTDTGKKIMIVQQNGINPNIDWEYDGTYIIKS